MLVFFEGIVMSFILLMYCVIGIRNGAVVLVCLYEKDVQERVVELVLGGSYKGVAYTGNRRFETIYSGKSVG